MNENTSEVSLPTSLEITNAINLLSEAHKNVMEVGDWIKGYEKASPVSVLTDLYFQARSIEGLIYFFNDFKLQVDETNPNLVQSDPITI